MSKKDRERHTERQRHRKNILTQGMEDRCRDREEKETAQAGEEAVNRDIGVASEWLCSDADYLTSCRLTVLTKLV